MNSVRWIESTSWELPFYGLPSRIPWPAEVDEAVANQEPLEIDYLLRAIEGLGTEAGEPWSTFLRANDHFVDFLEAMEENESRAAHEALARIEQTMPGTAFVPFHQALLARREGDTDQALERLEAAKAKAPQVAPIWSNLGAVYGSRGAKEQARAAFEKALSLRPGEPVALEGLASLGDLVRLRSTTPDAPEAVRYVSAENFRAMALQQVSGMVNASQLFEYGDQLLRDGTAIDAAIEAFSRANDLQPGQPRTLHALAAALRAGKRLVEAREVLERYTRFYPQDANGFLHLAECLRESNEPGLSSEALEKALEVDPNSRPALVTRFALTPDEHDPATEEKLEQWAGKHRSWMAHVLASAIAQTRGDARAVLRQAERAYALAPMEEEVLLLLASALGENKELGRLAATIRPAVESGKFSKRLDWHYAHVLRKLDLTKDALGVLQRALQGDVPAEFRTAANLSMQAWSGFLAVAGVRLEMIGRGLLQRPVAITLEEGDGAVLLKAGVPLPQETHFPWKPGEASARLRLQQGEDGANREPRPLGEFLVRGARPGEAVEVHLMAQADGGLHFRAGQDGRALGVTWLPR